MRELVARYGQAAYFAADGPRQLLEETADAAGGGRVQIYALPEQGGAGVAVNTRDRGNEGWIGVLFASAVAAVLSLPAMLLGCR